MKREYVAVDPLAVLSAQNVEMDARDDSHHDNNEKRQDSLHQTPTKSPATIENLVDSFLNNCGLVGYLILPIMHMLLFS
jgi:hypothetical protein